MHIDITGETALLPVVKKINTAVKLALQIPEDLTSDDICVVKAHDMWTVGDENINHSSVTKQRMSHQTKNITL
ncbi:hypothetical protein DPMN_121963 [Dreissena polymorpha]|uniref:Uncharacterized protein n=1 Tax=Dreissena polymorpha TaxID=45954 RepID=A0A9D4JRJ2_DREPO|nr:hypothetical protein DPMN_121963 [Dreissena polymorpha]